MRPITLLLPAGLVRVGATVLNRTVAIRGAASAHVALTAPDRVGAPSAPAELLGAHDAKAAVEQAVTKEAVLLVLGVGLDGTGLQVEVEGYAPPPRARLDAAPKGAACPLGHDDHGLGVIALNMIKNAAELIEVV